MNHLAGIGDVFAENAVANPQFPAGWNPQYENALGRQRADFKKLAPKFVRGQMPWDMFMDLFTTEKADYQLLGDVYCKKILYSKLTGEAFQMASPEYHPGKPEYRDLSFLHYAKKLGNLFEPESESGQAKLTFEQRVQLQGEHPSDYFQSKIGLFHRAYKKTHRDYEFFYNKVIIGLINQEMRNHLRLNLPKPLENTKAFRDKMMDIATVVRRKYLDGEISEAEAMGAEAYATIQLSDVNGARVESINAFSGQQKGNCYHCRSKDHYIAQCPRKAAGLPATVSSFQDKRESYLPVLYPVVRKVRSTGPKNTMSITLPNNKPKNRFQQFRKQKGKAGRIMFVYEEEGELQCEPVEEEEDINVAPASTEQEEAQEGVNIVEDQEEYSESDYIPGSFLGQNH